MVLEGGAKPSKGRGLWGWDKAGYPSRTIVAEGNIKKVLPII